jgi:hypothetical protein
MESRSWCGHSCWPIFHGVSNGGGDCSQRLQPFRCQAMHVARAVERGIIAGGGHTQEGGGAGSIAATMAYSYLPVAGRWAGTGQRRLHWRPQRHTAAACPAVALVTAPLPPSLPAAGGVVWSKVAAVRLLQPLSELLVHEPWQTVSQRNTTLCAMQCSRALNIHSQADA